jgi:hypothetical protein
MVLKQLLMMMKIELLLLQEIHGWWCLFVGRYERYWAHYNNKRPDELWL